MAVRYVSNGDWFDEGTEASLLDDYRPEMDAGLFLGVRCGEEGEEVCNFAEFTILEEPEV